jgi:hypothetical protein
MNIKIRQHIIHLVIANDKSHYAVEYLLGNIGLSVPTQQTTSQFFVMLNRSIVISIFSGILIGSITMHFMNEIPEVPAYEIFRWMAAIGIFGTLFSFVAGVKKGSAFKVLALGGMAGGFGHLSLKAISLWLGPTEGFWAALVDWFPKIIYGVSFGAALGIMTHVFQHYLKHKIQKLYLSYLAMAGVGAALFILLGWVERILDITDPIKVGLFATIGFLLTITVAVITNIFHSD